MAVEFTGANGQYLNYGAIIDGTNPKSICYHFNLDGYGGGGFGTHLSKYDFVSSKYYGWEVYNVTSGVLEFLEGFSAAAGYWITDTSSYSLSAWNHAVITYDNSNTTNNPIIYINGVSVGIIENLTPSGTLLPNTGKNLFIGNDSYLSNYATDGKLQDVRIYNRILSANEVEILAKSHCQNVVLNGLVFWAPLNGAAGMPKFEGVAMGASNYVRDVISGAIGTPVGNPLGAGNTIQRIR